MKSQLYLYPDLRSYYKEHIRVYRDFYWERLFPNFNNIEDEADQYARDRFDSLLSSPGDPSIDPSEIAEQVQGEAIQFYEQFNLVHYTFIASSISSLYVIWEQQLRKFLYEERKHDYEIDFEKFCTKGMNDIQSILNKYGIDITTFKSWDLIKELQLLNNTIKHGDGSSARKLYKINKRLFKEDTLSRSKIQYLDSTMLEENLAISQKDFQIYADNLIQFWDELPERVYEK